MHQRELRLALVCYGGVSLAVYMHGITKEVWHLARASRAFHHHAATPLDGVAAVYRDFLKVIERDHGLRLRVLPDVLTGASAGGINAVFLAQALCAGHSLEPLTDLWLENADVSQLTDPDAEPLWRFAKLWAQPIAEWFLSRPGNAVTATVSPGTRKEVRRKVSRLVRGRWFSPPFSGSRFSAMLYEAFQKMAAQGDGWPLLPLGYPIDLAVTATDFRGHPETLRLNSPPHVEETEHRLPINFRVRVGEMPGTGLADPLELVLAARATASFPGAFPPLTLAEIDRLAAAEGHHWANRGAFLSRAMPSHVANETVDDAALIDGSVLVNAPFGAALAALHGRPAQREVDRRFIYLDPRPDNAAMMAGTRKREVGFFGAIFGSLSTIPREQPIRDDLERIDQQSRDAQRLTRIVMDLQSDIDRTVEKLFGYTFLLDRPTPKRLAGWRAKAQQAAAEQAGYAFGPYALTKFDGILDSLAQLMVRAAGQASGHKQVDQSALIQALRSELEARGLARLTDTNGGATPGAIGFFRAHDTGFRIRRLQLLARKLARDWPLDPDISQDALDRARDRLFAIVTLYHRANDDVLQSPVFAELAAGAVKSPGAAIDFLAAKRLLPATDLAAEELLIDALEDMPKNLKRRMLLTYLGFPFYDAATLGLSKRDGLDEFNPVKIDRISPDDARSIREGGTAATLRGIEFYNFGAFFSRDYRENDYL